MAVQKEENDLLRAHLYLFAVLPALADAPSLITEARDVLGKKAFSVGFKVSANLRSCIGFQNGIGHFYGNRKTPADLELRFASASHLNAVFDGKKAPPPVPTRGFMKLGVMSTFQQIAALLEKITEQPPPENAEADTKKAYAELSLTVAFAGLSEMLRHDPSTQMAFSPPAPSGILVFSAGQDIQPFWLQVNPTAPGWGRGAPPATADVSIDFGDIHRATEALARRLDLQAAIGKGDIKTAGLIPLADNADAAMQNIERLLKAR